MEPPVSGFKYDKGDDFTSPLSVLLRGQSTVGTDFACKRLVEKVFRYHLDKEKAA